MIFQDYKVVPATHVTLTGRSAQAMLPLPIDSTWNPSFCSFSTSTTRLPSKTKAGFCIMPITLDQSRGLELGECAARLFCNVNGLLTLLATSTALSSASVDVSERVGLADVVDLSLLENSSHSVRITTA